MKDSLVELLILLVLAFLFPFPIMWLWNALMPTIFGLITINYWQAFGLYILCSLLFKSNNEKLSN